MGIVFSFMGTILSLLALVGISPALANIAIKFGPWEYFSITVFSLTLIITLSEENLVKGLITGIIGLMLATVGLAPIDSVSRYTFGSNALNGGFDILTVLVGVFAISEILLAAENSHKPSASQKATVITDFNIKGFGFSLKEFFSQIPNWHAHTPFFAGQEALRLCSKYNLPLIGTFHSKYYDDFYKATNAELIANIGVKFVVDFYERCDEVWTVSESSAVVLREYGYTGDIIIIENGTEMRPARNEDKQAVIEKFHIDAANPVFLFVGQINWKKGILRLLEAAAYLKRRGEKFTVVLAGQGPDEEAVKAKANELNVAEHVLFTGHLSDTHLLDASGGDSSCA